MCCVKLQSLLQHHIRLELSVSAWSAIAATVMHLGLISRWTSVHINKNVSEANIPLNGVYLLNVDDIEKISMCGSDSWNALKVID